MTTTELARRSAREFMYYTKHDFEEGRHHRLLADAVDRLIFEDNVRLIISLPPRHTKSEFFSIRLPAMYLGHHRQRDVVICSHTLNLAEGFSRQVRELLRDDVRYHKLFPMTKLSPDRQRVNDWRTTAGGGLKAIGVGGGLTGHGAHLLILDDIVKEGDEESPKTLDDHFSWYISAARTRLMPGGSIVIPMTRWHTRDIVGRLLQVAQLEETADQWQVIELPALATSEEDPLGREIGEALWPERYDEKALRAIEVTSEKYFQALYQQQPLDEGLTTFEDAIWRRFQREDWEEGFWAFDLAISEEDAGDFTTLGRWKYKADSGVLMAQKLERFQKTWPKVKKRIKEIMIDFPKDKFGFPEHLLELATVQDLKHELPEYANQIVGVKQKGDKSERASYHADRAASGRVWIEVGREGDSFIREHAEFPGDFDDWVDMASLAAHHFGLKQELRLILGQDEDERARQELLERESEYAQLRERLGSV